MTAAVLPRVALLAAALMPAAKTFTKSVWRFGIGVYPSQHPDAVRVQLWAHQIRGPEGQRPCTRANN